MMDSTIIVAIITSTMGVVGTIIGVIGTIYAKRSSKRTALSNGVLCLLRAEIIRNHDKYTERREIPIYAKESLEKVYTSYHELGGNGTMTDLYKECMELPVKGKKGGTENEN